MGYTRFEFKGKVAMGRSTFRFFILIPLIAIVLGLILSRLFIITALIGHKSPKVNKVDIVNYSYEDISPHRYFVIQVGIYSSDDNARIAQGEIKSKGFSACTYMDGKYYRVISYAALNKNDLDTKMAEYMKHGIQSIVKQLDITPEQVPDNMKQERKFILLNRMIDYCGEESDNCCSMCLKFESSKIDWKSVKQNLTDMNGKMSKKIQEFKSAAGSDTVMYNKMIDLCQSFQKMLAVDSSEDFSPVLFQERIINSVYIYKDMIKAYNDNINAGAAK